MSPQVNQGFNSHNRQSRLANERQMFSNPVHQKHRIAQPGSIQQTHVWKGDRTVVQSHASDGQTELIELEILMRPA